MREREYVKLEKKRLEPEDKGRLVTAFLEAFFKRYVEYDFTAYLEDRLDQVSDGKLDWKELLRDFWRDFLAAVNDIKDLRVTQVLDALNELLGPHIFPPKEDGSDPRLCPLCSVGPAFAENRPLRRLHRLLELSRMPLHAPAQDRRRQWRSGSGTRQTLCSARIPKRAFPCYLKNGRFGAYIQLGEGENGEKPKRASTSARRRSRIGDPRICA